jgi:hypothetical protein
MSQVDRIPDYYTNNYCNWNPSRDLLLRPSNTLPVTNDSCRRQYDSNYTKYIFNDCIFNPPKVQANINRAYELDACLALDRPSAHEPNGAPIGLVNPLYCQQPYQTSNLPLTERKFIELSDKTHPCYNVYSEYCRDSRNITKSICINQFCPSTAEQVNASPEAKAICDTAMIDYCKNGFDTICYCVTSKQGANANCFDQRCINEGYKTANQILNSGNRCPEICTIINFDDADKSVREEFIRRCNIAQQVPWYAIIIAIFVIAFIAITLILIYNTSFR